jgi:Fe-Mn family superoxide dismutase
MNLPYATDALQPYMSAETLEYHYGKHHLAYVNKLNELLAGTEFETMALEELITDFSGPIFNNAAQIWNHNLFWNTLKINS